MSGVANEAERTADLRLIREARLAKLHQQAYIFQHEDKAMPELSGPLDSQNGSADRQLELLYQWRDVAPDLLYVDATPGTVGRVIGVGLMLMPRMQVEHPDLRDLLIKSIAETFDHLARRRLPAADAGLHSPVTLKVRNEHIEKTDR